MSYPNLLNSTCTIQRKSQSQSATTGEVITAWTSLATGVACSIQAANGSEATLARRETGVTKYDGFFPYGQDIANGDRVVWSGNTLSVESNPDDPAGRGVVWVVELKEVRGGPQK